MYSLISNLFLSLLFDFCEAFSIQRILFLKSAFHFQVLRQLLFSKTHWFWLLYQDCWILLFPGKTWQLRETVIQCPYFTCTLTAHMYAFGIIIVFIIVRLSCEKLHNSTRDFLQLEHFFKANVSTSIPVLYIKTKSTETTVIIIWWPDLLLCNLHWFIRSYSHLNKERSVWPENISHHTCFAVMVRYKHDTSKLFWSQFDRWA